MRILLFLATNLAVVLVASVVLNLLGVGHYVSSAGLDITSLLIFCVVFGFAGSFVSLFMSKWMAKRSTGTYIITEPRSAEEKWLVDTVAELAQEAGIKMPEVGIFPSHQSNAFATGWNKNDALVAVSSGLLERFQPEETRAVMAHEIGHVANGDMVTLALIQGVVNTFVMFFARLAAYAIDSFLQGDDEESHAGEGIGYMITVFVFEILFGMLASMIVAWFSRRREYRADESGANFASTSGMIGALQRLKSEQNMPDELQGQFQAFGISSHLKQGFLELFSSHPPLEDRIAALQNRAR